MTGPDHYRKAEELTAKAHEYLGQGEGQDSAAVWAAVAQIHATLALAAATALGTTGVETLAWTEVAGTKFSAGASQTVPLPSLAPARISPFCTRAAPQAYAMIRT
jgi:hypothetical protein